jgi:Sporulation and spore germination
MTPRANRRVLVAALTLSLLLLIYVPGCGIGTQAEPKRLSTSQVPFSLLAPVHSAGHAGQPATVAVILYLLRRGHLVAVARELPAPASFDARLRALVAGPTTEEAGRDLSSVVSAPGLSFTGSLLASLAVINLPEVFLQLAADDQIDALAQLVYTATAIPDINWVSFRVNAQHVTVPRPDSSTTAAPVTRADYQALAPRIEPGTADLKSLRNRSTDR